jgi:hypothetical protein
VGHGLRGYFSQACVGSRCSGQCWCEAVCVKDQKDQPEASRRVRKRNNFLLIDDVLVSRGP